MIITSPTSSWREFCALVEGEGRTLADCHQGNFECWMRERAALNKAMLIFSNLGMQRTLDEIQTYMNRLERNQDELSAIGENLNDPQ